jgi:hypothetical protein
MPDNPQVEDPPGPEVIFTSHRIPVRGTKHYPGGGTHITVPFLYYPAFGSSMENDVNNPRSFEALTGPHLQSTLRDTCAIIGKLRI